MSPEQLREMVETATWGKTMLRGTPLNPNVKNNVLRQIERTEDAIMNLAPDLIALWEAAEKLRNPGTMPACLTEEDRITRQLEANLDTTLARLKEQKQ